MAANDTSFRDALRRLRRTEALTRSNFTPTEALVYLEAASGAEFVSALGRHHGETLPQIEPWLQLLPLGKRTALEAVGAISQENIDEPMFHVRARPFVLKVVRAAAIQASSLSPERRHAMLSEQFERLRNEQFEVQTIDDALSESLESVLPKTDAVGVISTAAKTVKVDGDSDLGAFEILTQREESFSPGVLVHFPLKRIDRVPAVGKTVRLEFGIALPTTKGVVFGFGRPNSQVVLKELRRSAEAKPGLVLVHYSATSDDGSTATFSDDADANGVAQLTAVDGVRVPIGA